MPSAQAQSMMGRTVERRAAHSAVLCQTRHMLQRVFVPTHPQCYGFLNGGRVGEVNDALQWPEGKAL